MESTKTRVSDLKAKVPTVTVGWRLLHTLIDGLIITTIAQLLNRFTAIDINILYLIFPLYYILFENFLQRTPGKYISKTIVVNDYGEKPSFKTIIIRTLVRYIPLEAFSCLDDYSRGWHDKWSNTYVIKESYLPKLRERLAKQES